MWIFLQLPQRNIRIFMEILEQGQSDFLTINGCDGNTIIINDREYKHSLILYKNQILPWAVDTIEDINDTTLAPLIALKPESILIGTGATFHCLEEKTLKNIINNNIGYECMKTLSACGSYQIMSSDGRDVALAIILE